MRCILRNPRVAVVRLLLVLDIPELDRASDAFIIGGRHTLPICDRCNYCSSLRYSTLYPSDEAEFLPRFVFHGSDQIFNSLCCPVVFGSSSHFRPFARLFHLGSISAIGHLPQRVPVVILPHRELTLFRRQHIRLMPVTFKNVIRSSKTLREDLQRQKPRNVLLANQGTCRFWHSH